VTGKSILVTGGAGFIGSHLAERIAAYGPSQLTVIDDLSLGSRSNLAVLLTTDYFVFRQIDMANREALFEALEAAVPDIVFNLAVVPLPASLVNPAACYRVNTETALHLCEAYRAGLLKKIVHFSSSEAYGSCLEAPMNEGHPLNATTPYAASKAAADLLIRSYGETFGLPWLIVRPFNNYGPRQNMADYAGIVPTAALRILRGLPVVVFGDGLQTRDYIYVDDTVEATILLSDIPAAWGSVVNVGSGREISMLDLVQAIAGALGLPALVEHRPDRVADVRRHVADTALLRDVSGFTPNVTIEEGMRRTVDWYRSWVRANAESK
jgi:UDP-glucose 4-epimerase